MNTSPKRLSRFSPLLLPCGLIAAGLPLQARSQEAAASSAPHTAGSPLVADPSQSPDRPLPAGEPAKVRAPRVDAPLNARRGAKSGPYYLQRWNDSYPTEAAAAKEGVFAPLKHIPLGGDAYLTLSGEERLQAIAQTYGSFAGGGTRNQTYFSFRHQYGADLHLNRNIRVFGQLVSAQQPAWNMPKPYSGKQQNSIDVAELFVEAQTRIADVTVGARVGRQQMSLGNGLLFGLQANANVEQAFDGIVAYANRPNTDLTLFAVKPVDYQNGAFDDRTSDTQRFYGAYGSLRLYRSKHTDIVLDPFLIRSENDATAINLVKGEDRRWTVGARLWGSSGLVNIDWTAAYQFGRFNEKTVSAAALLTESQVQIPGAPAKLRLAVRGDIATGGARDGSTVKTFRTFYPQQLYMTIMGFLTTSNVYDLGLGIRADPTPRLSLQAYQRHFWRYSTEDVVYGRGAAPLTSTAKSDASSIGTLWSISGRWQINKHVGIGVDTGYYKASGTPQQSGLRDVAYGLTELLFMF